MQLCCKNYNYFIYLIKKPNISYIYDIVDISGISYIDIYYKYLKIIIKNANILK